MQLSESRGYSDSEIYYDSGNNDICFTSMVIIGVEETNQL